MHKISLTDFVDVVSRSGLSKANKVKTIQQRGSYSPAKDFYKGLREAIIDIITSEKDKNQIYNAVQQATVKRREHYKQAADGFVKWAGKKEIKSFTSKKNAYGNGKIVVSVNPELGVIINGECHLIKLYFKSDKLPKRHASISTHLMKSCLESEVPKGTIMSVLDVKRGKLISYETPDEAIDAAMRGELAYIEALWREV